MSVIVASNTEALEREAERARMRLAESLQRLTSPSAQKAVKQQIAGYGTRLKDQALEYVQETKDNLLHKGQDAGREKAGGIADVLKQKASENPLGVALIGAGLAWHFYKKPPITTLLLGAGVAALMRSGKSGDDDRRSYRDPYRDDQPRGYVPGGVAGYGYPAEGPGAVGTMARNAAGLASNYGEEARKAAAEASEQVRETARDLTGRASQAASGLAERASEAVGQVRHAAEAMAEQASEAASDLVGTARGMGERAVQAVQGRAGQGRSPSYGYDDDFAGEWESSGAVDTYAGRGAGPDTTLLRPVALGVAGLIAGVAAYGYLRSKPHVAEVADDYGEDEYYEEDDTVLE